MGYRTKNFKIDFSRWPEYFVNEKKGVVICKVTGHLKTPAPSGGTLWASSENGEPEIGSKLVHGFGVAKCKTTDNFDEKVGKKIAHARAENQCYLEAMRYLAERRDDLLMLINATDEFIEKGYRCCAHNEDYINKIGQ